MNITVNRKAHFDYDLLEFFEAGVVLLGSEIKSIRAGLCNLSDAYGFVSDGNIELLNSYIAPYKTALTQHDPYRTRRLLLHKREIRKIQELVKLKKYILIATRLYFVRNNVKCELALAVGKKKQDKRAAVKERDEKREAAYQLKNRKE